MTDQAGTDPVAEEAEKQARLDRKATANTVFWRRKIGYMLGILTLGAFITLVCVVFDHLSKIDQFRDWPLALFVTFVAGHAAITIACVWLLYQMLKIAERLTIPNWWIDLAITKDPSLLHALIGVQDPMMGIKQFGTVMEHLAKPARSIVSGERGSREN